MNRRDASTVIARLKLRTQNLCMRFWEWRINRNVDAVLRAKARIRSIAAAQGLRAY